MPSRPERAQKRLSNDERKKENAGDPPPPDCMQYDLKYADKITDKEYPPQKRGLEELYNFNLTVRENRGRRRSGGRNIIRVSTKPNEILDLKFIKHFAVGTFVILDIALNETQVFVLI